MDSKKFTPLPPSLKNDLPRTLEEADSALEALVTLGLVTRHPDDSYGIHENILREAALDAAVAIVRSRE